MIAYRLHHEPGTLEIIHRVRKGDFGDPRIFSSVFTQLLKPENHRAKQGELHKYMCDHQYILSKRRQVQ